MKNKLKKIFNPVVSGGMKEFAGQANQKLIGIVDSSISYFENKRLDEMQRQVEKNDFVEIPEDSGQFEFIKFLPYSVIPLTDKNISKAKKSFPIPTEQRIIWMDAEFDLRPSGIVVTDAGVFIKSNTEVIRLNKFKESNEDQHEIKPSVLYYFKWDSFDASLFISDNPSENVALTVDPKCQWRFIDVCRKLSSSAISADEIPYFQYYSDNEIEDIISFSTTAAAAIQSADTAIFAENFSANNTPAGHGYFAEEAITIMDRLQGHSAEVIGRDNAKNGPDRLVDGKIFIQTKYYKSARSTLESSFDHNTGLYRYIKNGKPMQLEVPKDQYEKVLEGFKKKISDGKVPGVKDPAQAKNFVRKGKLTYQQALNLAKPGTIESLAYDAATGAVTCSFAFGLSFLATAFFSYRESGDMNTALQDGATVGIQTFGLSFVQHILVSQLGRTNLSAVLMKPSQQIVEKLGTKASSNIVNGIRALSGKSAIHGAAASKHLAKIFRNNVFTAAISFAVFSIPDSYRMLINKISGSQYAKNMGVLLSSFIGTAGGSVASGIAAAKIASIAGTTVAPGVGTVIGLAGGLIGGIIVSGATGWASDIIWESDVVKTQRLFNAVMNCMVSEYTLDETETGLFVDELGKGDEKALKNLFMDYRKSAQQEAHFRAFLMPYFEKIIEKRQKFFLPAIDDFYDAVLMDAGVEPGVL